MIVCAWCRENPADPKLSVVIHEGKRDESRFYLCKPCHVSIANTIRDIHNLPTADPKMLLARKRV